MNDVKIYAGIGSRETPPAILGLMSRLATKLASEGWKCRSGGAPGADEAFAAGAGSALCQYLPWPGFNGVHTHCVALIQLPATLVERAHAIAEKLHPAWDRCSPAAKRLHARNVFQVLGPDLKTPVRMVICWTPKGEMVGGTAMAMRVADAHGVEVVNLGHLPSLERVQHYLRGEKEPIIVRVKANFQRVAA